MDWKKLREEYQEQTDPLGKIQQEQLELLAKKIKLDMDLKLIRPDNKNYTQEDIDAKKKELEEINDRYNAMLEEADQTKEKYISYFKQHSESDTWDYLDEYPVEILRELFIDYAGEDQNKKNELFQALKKKTDNMDDLVKDYQSSFCNYSDWKWDKTPAEVRLNMLRSYLTAFLKKQCSLIEEALSSQRMTEDQINSLLSFRNTDTIGSIDYTDLYTNAEYFRKYGVAYACEYVLMYKSILEQYEDLEGREFFGVCSMGCGSLLDAWALVYAETLLETEGKAPIKLKYAGYDIAKWPVQLFEYDTDNSIPEYNRMCEAISDQMFYLSLANYELLVDSACDITKFLKEEGGDPLPCNALFFPKVLNEIKERDPETGEYRKWDPEVKRSFKWDELYICISHSPAQIEKGIEVANALIPKVADGMKKEGCIVNEPEHLKLNETPTGKNVYEIWEVADSVDESDRVYALKKDSTIIDLVDDGFKRVLENYKSYQKTLRSNNQNLVSNMSNTWNFDRTRPNMVCQVIKITRQPEEEK